MTTEPEVRRAIRVQPQAQRTRRLAALASRQHGVVAREQLAELGFSRDAIWRRLSNGSLTALHRGVYAVGHRALTARGQWLAAVLACGPGAVLSHDSAAALLGFCRDRGGAIDVTVAAAGRRARRGVRIHQVGELAAADRTSSARIPVTAVPRVLLDLAARHGHSEVARAFEEAQRQRLVSARAVANLVERRRGHRGVGVLAALVVEDLAAVTVTRSELEARFLAVCREAGLPRPLVNVRIAGFEVDAVWLAERLVVELDGYAFHRTRMAFERDRARDAALQLAGYRVVRITYRMLESDPSAVAALVRSLLASLSRPGHSHLPLG